MERKDWLFINQLINSINSHSLISWLINDAVCKWLLIDLIDLRTIIVHIVYTHIYCMNECLRPSFFSFVFIRTIQCILTNDKESFLLITTMIGQKKIPFNLIRYFQEKKVGRWFHTTIRIIRNWNFKHHNHHRQQQKQHSFFIFCWHFLVWLIDNYWSVKKTMQSFIFSYLYFRCLHSILFTTFKSMIMMKEWLNNWLFDSW